MNAPDPIRRTAYGDSAYRYVLRREWAPGTRGVTFVMLNPSTADDVRDDPTVRRVVRFAHGWGYGSAAVVNLYPYRATDPAVLEHVSPAVMFGDPTTYRQLFEAAVDGGDVVVAWGARVGPFPGRAWWAVFLIVRQAARVDCLGWCANGQPRHPLYVQGTTPRRDARARLAATWEVPL